MLTEQGQSSTERIETGYGMGMEYAWGLLPIMAYMGRLHPKGVPFSAEHNDAKDH